MKHIFEHAGVMLEVDYSPGTKADPQPTFHTIHVIDANYRACGPNLIPFLHNTLRMVALGEAETFLSTIVADLP